MFVLIEYDTKNDERSEKDDMSVDLELLHVLLMRNADIGVSKIDLAFALGTSQIDTEVVLINEGSKGHVKEEVREEEVRYFTLKKHLSKVVPLRTEDPRLIRLHQALQSSLEGMLLSEIQQKANLESAELEELLFAEKTVDRIGFVSEESHAYRSFLVLPVDQLVQSSLAPAPLKKSSAVPKIGAAIGFAGIVYYLLTLF